MATAGARYTKVSSRKWNDPWYLALTPQQRNLFDYLAENGDVTAAGVYQCDLPVARMKTQPWRAGRFEETLARFDGHVQFYGDGWVFVVRYLRHNGDNMNPNFAQGIEAFMAQAPPQVQADFWAVYQKDSRLNKFGVPSESTTQGLPKPSVTPGRTIPGRTIPTHTKSSSPSRDLTADQKKCHTAAIAAFHDGMERLTTFKNPVGWRKADKGHAAKFFKECLLEGDTGQDLLDCVAEFFARHRGYEAEMKAKGKTRHTAPSFKRFHNQYLSLMRAVVARRDDARTG